MKALEILRTILTEAEISVEEREEFMEAIAELEVLKYNYEAQTDDFIMQGCAEYYQMEVK